MKLLPAALLTLLSASASSILPSVAAEKESASGVGVARKLFAKSVKGGDCDPPFRWDGRNCIVRLWMEQETAKFQALYFSEGAKCTSDKNGDGVVSGDEEVAALCYILGVKDEGELNGIGVLPNTAGAYTAESIAKWIVPVFLEADDEQVAAMNGALSGLVGITAGCS